MANLPGERRPRKLIIACDGTWMNSDIGWENASLTDRIFNRGTGHPVTPSNVTRICRATEPEDPFGHPQVIYYQNGLGSSYSSIDHVLGGGLAMGLSENIRSAYGFLVNNYLEKDLIYFVGFSRGAFTARSIAGIVATFGILTKKAMSFFYEIFEDFEGAGEVGYKPRLPDALQRAGIKITKNGIAQEKLELPKSDPPKGYLEAYATALEDLGFKRTVNVVAVAVFDTVGSLGLPVNNWFQKLGASPTLHKYRFYDTGIDPKILHAFQALALDEHRSAFSPTVWERKDDNTVTKLKQVWFPGVHCSVGGGDDDTGLSDITLAWMMSNLATISSDRPELNIHFNKDYLKTHVQANREAYKTQVKYTSQNPPAKWGYGLGEIENSYVFPTRIAGYIDRSPRNYYRVKYDTGKPTGERLTNTNEYIHVSVRARMLNKGKNWNGEPYFSTALGDSKFPTLPGLKKRWGLAESSGRHIWSNGDVILEEDELGIYEKEVFDKEDWENLFEKDKKGAQTTVTEDS